MDLEKLFQFMENNSYKIGHTVINPMNLIFLIIIFGFIFIYQGRNCYKRDIKLFDPKYYYAIKMYHIERSIFNFIVNCVVSYILIIFINTAANIALNFVIIPLISLIISSYINAWFKSQGWIMNKMPTAATPSEKVASQPVTVNIETASPPEIIEGDEFYDFNNVEDRDIDVHGIPYFINLLKRNQHILNNRLIQNEKNMNKQSTILEALRDDRISEKHIELETLIYSSLNQGFVTPAQDKLIREKYRIYRLLGGNGDIQMLFEGRYLSVPVHDDRRRANLPYDGVDRRKKI